MGLLPNRKPQPVSAIRPDPDFVSVIFDQDLQELDVLGQGPWSVRVNDLNRPVLYRSRLTLREISLALGSGTPDPGPTQVSYVPPPFEVVGTNELAADAFTLPIEDPPEE